VQSGSTRSLILPFSVFGTAAAVLTVATVLYGGLAAWQWVLAIGGGLLLWTFIEYTMHRFAFHEWRAIARLTGVPPHQKHHDLPAEEDYIVTPLPFSFPIAVTLYGIFWAATGWQIANLVMAGVFAGNLLYETVHLLVHIRPGGGSLLKRWRRYHFRHHYADSTASFGVTTPLWDALLGTLPSRQIAGQPAAHRQASGS
jgi:4-hydroxysphinganine ceramide fatty acyl 2-hydroxylase